jgi:sigma-B regulation protein RsbU (phosphoserine phosphatase)
VSGATQKHTAQPPPPVRDPARESEEKYRALFRYIAVGVFRSTPGAEGRFLEVNPALVRMLGYDDERDLLRMKVADLYQNPADRLEFSEKISRDGFVRHEELALRKKDGSPIVVSETAVAVRDPAGRILHFDGVIEDITELKKAEKQTLVQKAYFETLFNNAPEAIILHTNEDRILNVNAEFTRLFGYVREEVVGKPIDDVVASPDYRDEAAEISRRVLRGERVELDSKRKRKDGSLIDVSILGAPIIIDGKQEGDYAIYRDITERKKTEEDILIQKAYLEKLFNSAPEAIVLHDNDDIVLNVNEEFCRMFGYAREEAIGRPINSLVAPEEFQAEAAGLSSKVIHGQRVEADTRRKRKDGTLIDVWILGAPIVHGGKQMGVYAIYRDITERRKAEESRIRLKEEARMARNIQLNFLPKGVPDVAGYDIAGKSIPALNVGGDYYDFIPLDEHRFAVSLGDVSGNGLAAALVMANLQATIRGQAMFDPEPARVLERANRLLFRSTNSRTFISLFYGILDNAKNTLTYANAGQDLPVLFGPGNGRRALSVNGIVLGVMEDAVYREEEVVIGSGERLLLYTDGIPEAMNSHREQFGVERLTEIVQRERAWTVRTVIENIFTAVHAYADGAFQADDMTVVMIERKNSL